MSTTTPTSTTELILGRPEHQIDLSGALEALRGERIMVTGALGSIGCAVRDLLGEDNHRDAPEVFATDVLEHIDVTSRDDVMGAMDWWPTLILHLAAAKHAPEGETDPYGTIETNVTGTRNVLEAAAAVGANVVTASTCKACNPQTVYGATKLLAERMTLEAGGAVARFHNVIESSGNVFRIWEELPEHSQIPVTPCSRYFITLREAASLVIAAAVAAPGRYGVMTSRRPRPMPSVAAALYPDRPQQFVPIRRGDRQDEPQVALEERVMPVSSWMWRIESPYDRDWVR